MNSKVRVGTPLFASGAVPRRAWVATAATSAKMRTDDSTRRKRVMEELLRGECGTNRRQRDYTKLGNQMKAILPPESVELLNFRTTLLIALVTGMMASTT